MATAAHRGDHPKVRAQWKARLKSVGALPCAEPVHVRGCPGLIQFGMRFDLAHDRASGGYRGIAWPACNRAEGARFGNRLRAARRRAVIRATSAPSRSW